MQTVSIAGVGIHPRIETVCKKVGIVIVDFVLVSLVIGKVQLPVESQLREHIAGMTGGAAGHLAVDGVVAETHALAGLGNLGEIVVGNFRHGIAALVDVVADLMGDAPAEEVAALVAAVLLHNDGVAFSQAGYRTPADADVVARRVHERAGKHTHIADVQVLGRQTVLIPGARQIGQALMLVEQRHHLVHSVHGVEQALGFVSRGPAAQARQQLADRYRVHHLVQHHIGGVEDAGLCVVGAVVAVELAMPGFQFRGVGFHRFHIGRDTGFALGGIVNAVEIQHGHLFAAADAHRVTVIGTVTGELHVQGAAVLGIKGNQFGNADLVAADLELDRSGNHLSRFGVVLGGNQLQPGIGTGSYIVAAYVDDDLVAGGGRHTQGLPGIQAGEAQVAVLLGRDGGMYLHHIVEGGFQQTAGVIQFALERHTFGVQFAAGLIGGVQPGLQVVEGALVHFLLQRYVEVVGIQRQNVIFQAVVLVEPHLGDGNRAVPVGIPHADAQIIGGDTTGDLDGKVVAAAVVMPDDGHTRHLVFTALLIASKQADLAVTTAVLGLGQRDAADMVAGVKGDAQTVVEVVAGTVVPVIHTVPGGEIVIHSAPGGVAGIQRAVLHITVLMGDGQDMGCDLAGGTRRVQQLVGRHLDRVHVGRRCRGSQRGGAFAQLVDAGDIHLIAGVVFQALNGVAVLGNPFDLDEVPFALFAIVDVIGFGILHVLPGRFNALEAPGQCQGVGGGGQFVGFGDHRDGLAVAAAPFTVDRLHLDGVGLAVLQFFTAEAAHRQGVGGGAHGFGFIAEGDGNFVPGDVYRRVPGQGEGLAFGHSLQSGGNVHRRGRDTGFHIVEELYLGDLRQVSAARHRSDLDGDLLDGDLCAEVDLDGAVGLHRGCPHKAGQHPVADGDVHGFGLAVFLVFHRDGGAVDSGITGGRGLQHQARHGQGFLGRFLKVKADGDGVILRDSFLRGGFQFHRRRTAEQIVQAAADDLGGFFRFQFHQAFGHTDQHRGGAVPVFFQAGGQHLQVHQVHGTAAVQVHSIAGVGAFPFKGIDQCGGIPLAEGAVAVHVTDAQRTGMEIIRGVGISGQEAGVQLYRIQQIFYLNGLGVIRKAAAADRQRVAAPGQVPEADLLLSRHRTAGCLQRDLSGAGGRARQADGELHIPLQRQTRQQRDRNLRRILRGTLCRGFVFVGFLCHKFNGRKFLFRCRYFRQTFLGVGGRRFGGSNFQGLCFIRFRHCGLHRRFGVFFRKGGRALGQDAEHHAGAQQGGDGSFHFITSFLLGWTG